MKSVNHETWAPPQVLAQAFNCHENTVCRWGREERFGYKQKGPGRMLVNVSEAVEYYSKRYPKAEINLEVLAPYMQPTA